MHKRSLRCVALAVAFASAAVPASSADPEKAESYLSDARKTLDKGDRNAAIIQFKKALQEQPDNAAARFELGRAYLRVGDLVSAEKELRLARDLKYPEQELSVEFARLYLRQHKYDQVIAEILPGDRPAEDESVVRLARGLAYTQRRQLAEAEAAINEAMERTSKPSRALIALARVRQVADDHDGAVATIQRAIDADPKNAQAWLTKGQIHASKGDRVAARAAMDKAIEIRPGYEEARLARAELLIAGDEPQLAQPDVDAILKANPRSSIANYLNAQLLVHQKNYRAAEAALLNMRQSVDTSPKALYLLATVHLEQEQLEQAETNINRYLTLMPNEPRGTIFLADLLTKRRNLPRAVKVLETASDRQPEDAELLAALGDAYRRNKEREKAAVAFDKAARLYSVQKEDARALEFAEKAYGQAKTSAVSDTLGWILVQKGDTERALPILEKASTEAAGTPQIRYHYAVALLKAGRAADAKRELEMVVQANQPIEEIADAKAMLKDLGG